MRDGEALPEHDLVDDFANVRPWRFGVDLILAGQHLSLVDDRDQVLEAIGIDDGRNQVGGLRMKALASPSP